MHAWHVALYVKAAPILSSFSLFHVLPAQQHTHMACLLSGILSKQKAHTRDIWRMFMGSVSLYLPIPTYLPTLPLPTPACPLTSDYSQDHLPHLPPATCPFCRLPACPRHTPHRPYHLPGPLWKGGVLPPALFRWAACLPFAFTCRHPSLLHTPTALRRAACRR